jgi:hypothetical protein
MQNTMLKTVLIGSLLVFGCNRGSTPDTGTGATDLSETQQTDRDETMSASNNEMDDSPSRPLGESTGQIELNSITLDPPDNWQSKPPASSLIAAEFVLPRAETDDADGRLTISSAGGTVEANIDRWKGQFDPQPKEASQQEVDVSGFKITIVDYSGDFNDQRGPFAPAVKRPGYRMIGAVIPVDGELHFIKATGPQKTLDSHADAIHSFIRSARAK